MRKHGLRPEEEWARAMIRQALAVPVEQHDDGSQAGMYDLDILHNDQLPAAVEITAAADAAAIELWNLMNGDHGRWQVSGLRGGWMVTLDPKARANRLRRELPGLLIQLEHLEVREIRPRRRRTGPLDGLARELGITDASQSDTRYPGSIYITLQLPAERSGGFLADTGNALAAWVGDFLRDPDQRDVREKLVRSGASERHAFVLLPGFTAAPFSVSYLLMREGAPLPVERPQLPPEVTHVWAVSTWSTGVGFRWCPDGGWTMFDKTIGSLVG